MNYTIYSIATNEVLRWGNVPEEAVDQQVQEGEYVVKDALPDPKITNPQLLPPS